MPDRVIKTFNEAQLTIKLDMLSTIVDIVDQFSEVTPLLDIHLKGVSCVTIVFKGGSIDLYPSLIAEWICFKCWSKGLNHTSFMSVRENIARLRQEIEKYCIGKH